MLTQVFDWLSSLCGAATFAGMLESPDSLSDVKGKIYASLAEKLGSNTEFPLATTRAQRPVGWFVEEKTGCGKAVELTEKQLKLARRLITQYECTNN